MPVCKDCGGRGKREYGSTEGSIEIAGSVISSTSRFTVDVRDCAECGGTGRWLGRRDVMQDGERIGTLHKDCDPSKIKSLSFWYQPRCGDFVRDGEAWVARRDLGPGDLEAVPGFVWKRNET
jgi:hypothetical protein